MEMAGTSSRLRVAVVGAGAAGLIALRHLSANPQRFEAKGFEMTPNVSGTWVYTDRTGTDERGLPLHVSMYKNLRTNLPKEVMAIPDFPFKPGRSFVHHGEVHKYLEEYCFHHRLQDVIQFNTLVEHISPDTSRDGNTIWNVHVRDVTTPDNPTEKHLFDAVMICNGHYAVPLMPPLPGLATYTGRLIHSHDYRQPEVFTGKNVAILGAGASGLDICVDLSSHARRIFLCHRKGHLPTTLPTNTSQHAGIKEVQGDRLLLEDGSMLDADVLLLCTGYHYNFDFLSDECRPRSEDERVTPLYKHVIHTAHPTLSFIGVVKKVCPFPLFDCQVRFVLAALDSSMRLPTMAEMDADTEADFQGRLSEGLPPRHAHTMGTKQWGYVDQLAELAGFDKIPRVTQRLYDQVHIIRTKDVSTYKNVDYELVSTSEYREVLGRQ